MKKFIKTKYKEQALWRINSVWRGNRLHDMYEITSPTAEIATTRYLKHYNYTDKFITSNTKISVDFKWSTILIKLADEADINYSRMSRW